MIELFSSLAPKNRIFTYNQLFSTYKIVDEIIENLDEYALNELLSGNESDLDKLLDIIVEETNKAIHTDSGKIKNSSFGYLDKLTENLDIILKELVFNYFVVSVLYDFEINWHHIEWGNLIQLYKWVCILAARDHSKSFTFSKAYPLWKLYRYKKNFGYNQKINKELNFQRGMLITSEFSLGKDFLGMIKEEIETNDLLRDTLYPKILDNWGATEIVCRNGAELKIKSYESRLRGRHPGWIVVDDMLDDSVLYSVEQRKKYIEFFHSTIMNLILPQGQTIVVGCVGLDTVILNKNKGFLEIGDLIEGYKEKDLKEEKLLILDKNKYVETSHIFYNGKTKARKIICEGNYKLDCSLIHPLWKMSEEGIPYWEQSQNLKIGDWIALSDNEIEDWGEDFSLIDFKLNYRTKRKTINRKSLNLPDYLNEDLCYLIGLFIAEGTIYDNYGIEISATEIEIISFLENLKKYDINFRKQEQSLICSNLELYDLFRYLGFNKVKSNLKTIPKILLSIKKRYLISLLQGLFDGDGSCTLLNSKFPVINYSATSKNLIYLLKNILQIGFGIKNEIGVTLKENIKEEIIEIKGKKYPLKSNFDQYNLDCNNYEAIKFLKRIGFRLKRKQKYIEYENSFINYQPLPFQDKIFNKIRSSKSISYTKEMPSFLQESGKGICEEYSNKFIIKEKINWMINNLQCKNLEVINQFKRNFEEKVRWIKIKKIEEIETLTADFVIPETNSFISNGFISHNTPFHEKDLYSDLKSKKQWKVFEYPAIFPDGSLLWENRYNLNALLEKRNSQGSIIFSREILCKPISSESTIFPYHIIERSYLGMEEICLAKNYYSFSKKFVKKAIGCDFAISSEIGSDYTVFIVVGVDDLNNFWLLNMWRERGASYNKQIAVLKQMKTDFDPDIIYAESNAFQKVMIDIANDNNLGVTPHVTGTNKYDLKNGLPGLAILFEQNRIRFPRGDVYSRDITDIITQELSSITWSDSKKIESVSEHDDTAYALWLSIKGIHYVNESFSYDFI